MDPPRETLVGFLIFKTIYYCLEDYCMNIRTLILEAIEDEIRIRKEIEELYDINKGKLRFKTKSGELLVLGLESVLITDKTISDKLGIPHFLYYSFNRYFGDKLFPFSLREQNVIKSIGLEDKQYNISDKKNSKYYCFKLIKAYLYKYNKDLASALQAYLSISKSPEEAKQDAQNILNNYNMLEAALKRYNELIRQYREDLSDKQTEQPKKQPPPAATEDDQEESEEEVAKDDEEEKEAPSAQETPPPPPKPKFKVGDRVVYIKDPSLGYYLVKSIDGDKITLEGEGNKVFTGRAELYRLK